jgi:hypothetical protein
VIPELNFLFSIEKEFGYRKLIRASCGLYTFLSRLGFYPLPSLAFFTASYLLDMIWLKALKEGS